MKKSFMTRALATGLSLAMAFSLTAATNVTVASAASTPAMASKQFAVRVGGATKTYKASTATRKSFKISKAVVGNTDKATVVVKSNKKAIKVTPGTVSGSTVVKVTFKNIKTKKTTTKKYRCVVKPEVSKELTMTAEATGVKKIAVTFNQAVDTTTTKIVVKKGSATPTIAATTYATDATSAELAMGTKLTAGTYTVEVTAGEKVLTADITVKDEAMTAFQLVSTNLVAKPNSSAAATISYKAVNQYGEPMAASNVKATCSFGTVNESQSKTPTADKSGTVVVENIPSTLAIEGQTGTLVLVNQENGVNLNETVTYRSKAVAGAANVLGIYDDKTEKVVEGNIKVGATISQYKILVNIQDQYGSDMSVEDIANSESDVSLNPASVLTDLTIPENAKTIKAASKTEFTEVTYDGKTCVAIPLTSSTTNATTIQKAGTLSLTMVGANKGVLATPSFTVDDVVLIESFSVSAADTLYEGTKTKLIVDAVDVNGNAVTKYEELKAAFQNLDAGITLEKNADGTGTFYYTPASVFASASQKQNTSLPVTKMFYANEPTSGKYLVKPVSFTVYEAKVNVKVAGIASDAVTAVANTAGAILTFDLGKLTVEDQYSNTKGYNDIGADKDNVTYALDDSASIFSNTDDTTAGKIKFTASGKKGNATLYLKYKTNVAGGDNKAADADNYDIKVTLSAVDVSGVTAGDLTLKVNDGKMIYGADKIAVQPSVDVITVKTDATGSVQTASAIVTAKVGGKNVVIPTEMYTITEGASLGDYKKVGGTEKVAEKTEEKTVTIVFGDAGTEKVSTKVTVSNADAKATEIKKADSNKVGITLNATALCTAVKIMDQYGNEITGKGAEVICTVTFTGKNADELQKDVTKNATQAVGYKTTVPTGATASVTYSYAGLTFTTDVVFE